MIGDYLMVFDNKCKGWSTNPEQNLNYVKTVQRECNNKLLKEGHLYLKDVFDIFEVSIPFDWLGSGWSTDESKLFGDNYIDFGLYDIYRRDARNFVNGKSTDTILKFNCDVIFADPMIDSVLMSAEDPSFYFDYPAIFGLGG